MMTVRLFALLQKLLMNELSGLAGEFTDEEAARRRPAVLATKPRETQLARVE